MKKQIVKEFITVKYVRYLPKPAPPPPPPPPRRVLVVGRCTFDLVTVIGTYPPEMSVTHTKEGCWRRGGSASNICTVLRRLGQRCEFLGLLSSLQSFETVSFDLIASGIEIINCPRMSQAPPHRTVIITTDKGTATTIELANRHQELTYQHFLGAVYYKKYSWIHFEARNARETYRMIRAVRDYNERAGDNIIISVDLRNLFKQNLTLADLADYVFVHNSIQKRQCWMNGHEACRMMREKLNLRRTSLNTMRKKKCPYQVDEEEPTCNKARQLPIIICPDTWNGACCVDSDDNFIKVSGHKPLTVVDRVGEHDAFCASVIYALDNAKMSLRDALEYGTRVASFKLTVMGLQQVRCVPKDLLGFYYQ